MKIRTRTKKEKIDGLLVVVVVVTVGDVVRRGAGNRESEDYPIHDDDVVVDGRGNGM